MFGFGNDKDALCVIPVVFLGSIIMGWDGMTDVFNNLKKDLFDGDAFKDLDIRLEEL
jgi:hypothetical protein